MAFFALLFCLPARAGQEPSVYDLAERGQARLRAGRYYDAAADLALAARLDPGNEWVWAMLGRAYVRIGELGEAWGAFARALALNPRDSSSRLMIELIRQHPLPPGQSRPKMQGVRFEALAARAKEEHARGGPVPPPGPGRVLLDPGPPAVPDVGLALAREAARALAARGVEVLLLRDGAYSAGQDREVAARLWDADRIVLLAAGASGERPLLRTGQGEPLLLVFSFPPDLAGRDGFRRELAADLAGLLAPVPAQPAPGGRDGS